MILRHLRLRTDIAYRIIRVVSTSKKSCPSIASITLWIDDFSCHNQLLDIQYLLSYHAPIPQYYSKAWQIPYPNVHLLQRTFVLNS